MKLKASKTVRPNMTLLESVKTQNAIQQSRMHVYLRKVMIIFTSTPLWSSSATARKVDTFCESQLQQNKAEYGNYQCRVICESHINMIRSTCLEPYCTECDGENICISCCDESAIARYKRRRSITFYRCSETQVIVVQCSCTYHPVMGIPCRHICIILPVTAEHVHVRWLRKYFALYGRNAPKELMKYFKKKQYDRRIKITDEEYLCMMDKAKEMEENFGSDDPLFCTEKPYILYRKTSSGCIPFHLYDPDCTQSSKIDNLYDAGNLLQECMNGGINDDVSDVRPMLTGNVYCDYELMLKTVIPQLENDAKLNNYFCRKYFLLQIYKG